MKRRIKETPKMYEDAEGRRYENPPYSTIIEKKLKYVKKELKYQARLERRRNRLKAEEEAKKKK